MDAETKQVFDNIVAKDVSGLTGGDIDFLKARSEYLSEEDKNKFASVLKAKKEKVTDEDEEGDDKKKSSKK